MATSDSKTNMRSAGLSPADQRYGNVSPTVQAPTAHGRLSRSRGTKRAANTICDYDSIRSVDCRHPLRLGRDEVNTLLLAMQARCPLLMRAQLTERDAVLAADEWSSFIAASNDTYQSNTGPATDNAAGFTHSRGRVRIRDVWHEAVRIETGLQGVDDPNPVVDFLKSAPMGSTAARFRVYQSSLREAADKAFAGASETVEPSFVTCTIRPGGCSTHFDEYENVAMLIQGRKTFYVASPDSISKHGSSNERADTAPHDGEVQWLRAELRAGDALYLPSGWWHHVVSVPHTIMTNYWKFTEAREGP